MDQKQGHVTSNLLQLPRQLEGSGNVQPTTHPLGRFRTTSVGLEPDALVRTHQGWKINKGRQSELETLVSCSPEQRGFPFWNTQADECEHPRVLKDNHLRNFTGIFSPFGWESPSAAGLASASGCKRRLISEASRPERLNV